MDATFAVPWYPNGALMLCRMKYRQTRKTKAHTELRTCMTDDIVTRLRDSSGMTTCRSDDGFMSIVPDTMLMREAADEIERLRKQRDGWLQMLKDLYNTARSDPNAYAFDLPLLNMMTKVVKAVRGE